MVTNNYTLCVSGVDGPEPLSSEASISSLVRGWRNREKAKDTSRLLCDECVLEVLYTHICFQGLYRMFNQTAKDIAVFRKICLGLSQYYLQNLINLPWSHLPFVEEWEAAMERRNGEGEFSSCSKVRLLLCYITALEHLLLSIVKK
jgi:hypothetical protein